MANLTKTQQDILISGLVKTLDFHQKRIVNAAPAINNNDYVIKKQLNTLEVITATEVEFATSAQLNTLYIFNNLDTNLKHIALYDGTAINLIFNF